MLAVAWPQSIEKNVKVHLIDAFLGTAFVATRSKGALCCAVPTILGIVMVIDMANKRTYPVRQLNWCHECAGHFWATLWEQTDDVSIRWHMVRFTQWTL